MLDLLLDLTVICPVCVSFPKGRLMWHCPLGSLKATGKQVTVLFRAQGNVTCSGFLYRNIIQDSGFNCQPLLLNHKLILLCNSFKHFWVITGFFARYICRTVCLESAWQRSFVCLRILFPFHIYSINPTETHISCLEQWKLWTTARAQLHTTPWGRQTCVPISSTGECLCIGQQAAEHLGDQEEKLHRYYVSWNLSMDLSILSNEQCKVAFTLITVVNTAVRTVWFTYLGIPVLCKHLELSPIKLLPEINRKY